MGWQTAVVLGLGPMGQAIARALLDARRQVTVWNRTADKADALVAAGAQRGATAEAAVAAGGPVLLSLRDHDAVRDVLGSVAELDGRAIVNLSSGTPAEARHLAAWVAQRGGHYLSGGLRVPPTAIGSPGARAFVSGERAALDAARPLLDVLVDVDDRGEDPGSALVWYQLEESLLWTTMTGWLQALALARAEGLTAGDLAPSASRMLDAVLELQRFYAPRIDAGDHGGELDTLASAAASVDHVVQTARDAGVDASLPAAAQAAFQRALAAGHGGDSTTSLVEILAAAGSSRR